VKSREIVFFEHGLPPPTLLDSTPPIDDAGDSVVQPPLPPTTIANLPMSPHVPSPAIEPATVPVLEPEPMPSTVQNGTPHPRITIRLPGRYMNSPNERPVSRFQRFGRTLERDSEGSTESDDS
jgi:hypothetical protein